MPLSKQEIEPGAVAYYDSDLVLNDDRISDAGLPLRDGPLICVQSVNGRSVWCPLTTQFRPERLLIRAEWRLKGSQKWREDDIYLNDGANTFVGPDEAFVAAAANEIPFTVIDRPRVSMAGVEAIIVEIKNRAGKLL
jgi:hypothetical protein